jgi:AraC-like DNA-binding protein
MTHAKKLLDSDKDYNITDIALKCGYEDHSNFTRAFKSVFGITPTQHKKDQACRNTIKDTTEQL